MLFVASWLPQRVLLHYLGAVTSLVGKWRGSRATEVYWKVKPSARKDLYSECEVGKPLASHAAGEAHPRLLLPIHALSAGMRSLLSALFAAQCYGGALPFVAFCCRTNPVHEFGALWQLNNGGLREAVAQHDLQCLGDLESASDRLWRCISESFHQFSSLLRHFLTNSSLDHLVGLVLAHWDAGDLGHGFALCRRSGWSFHGRDLHRLLHGDVSLCPCSGDLRHWKALLAEVPQALPFLRVPPEECCRPGNVLPRETISMEEVILACLQIVKIWDV